MRREAASYSLIVVTIILATQLFALVPISQSAQNENKRTTSMRVDPAANSASSSRGQGSSRSRRSRCYRRCRREYNRCLTYAGRNQYRRRACATRYRKCLKRCG
ncbi:MAG TPA: hypothetical protein VGC66_24715 [Pyrinomonadaceae bacterium]